METHDSRGGTAITYEQTAGPLTAIVEQLPDGAWGQPSPCAGWTAADVLQHIIDTQREVLAEAGPGLGVAPDVRSDPRGAWAAHLAQVREILSDPAVGTAVRETPFGPLSLAERLDRFYGFDMVAHRWDIGRAAGLDVRLTEAELDLLEERIAVFGEHLYGEGICAPALPVTPDASRQTKVLALLGRDSAGS